VGVVERTNTFYFTPLWRVLWIQWLHTGSALVKRVQTLLSFISPMTTRHPLPLDQLNAFLVPAVRLMNVGPHTLLLPSRH
jgi:hypothetical protein